jgi:hypothetical protein
MKLAQKWILQLTTNSHVTYHIQIHEDQDISKLRAHWGGALNIDGDQIKISRKSNSGKLSGRNWRSEFGVLSMRVHDTYFRSKLQAWMDYLQEQW